MDVTAIWNSGQEADDALVGATLDGRYRVLKRIGEGGMGTVYRGEHMLMGKPVAIKFLHTEMLKSQEFVQRFEREARSVSRLSHPHILQVTDFGRFENNTFYLVMELIEGEVLADILYRERRFSEERALTIIAQILEALEHAHSRGVIHRDLKPENIMLLSSVSRDHDFVKLLDFGIAKVQHGEGTVSPKLTQEGLVFGTPDYMSPEQALGEEVDARTDIYACGVLLFEMLTGFKPFQADVPMRVITLKINHDPPRMKEKVNVDLPHEMLEDIVAKALARNVNARFQSASEFLGKVRHALEVIPSKATLASISKLPPPVVTIYRAYEMSRRFAHSSAMLAERIGMFAMARLPSSTQDFVRRCAHRWTKFPRVARRAFWVSAAFASVTFIWLSARSSDPASIHPGVMHDASSNLGKIEKSLEQGKIAQARALIEKEEKSDPTNPIFLYFKGNIFFLEHAYESGLTVYEELLTRDASYKSDPVLVRDVMGLLDDKKYATRAMQLLTRVGRPACPAFVKVATTEKRTDLRQQGRAAAQQSGCEHFDMLDSYLLDLTQAKTCDEKRTALEEVARLNDARALKTLYSFRDKRSGLFGSQKANACVNDRVREIIESIKTSGNSQKH